MRIGKKSSSKPIRDMANEMPRNFRNIPFELAQVQRERGSALTRADFLALGYTTEQLSEPNILKAAEIYASLSERQAA